MWRYKIVFLVLFYSGFISCFQQEHKPKTNDDTINSGTIQVSVDETLKPLMQAEFDAFENHNPKAHLVVTYKPEGEVFDDFSKDSARVVIVTRELTGKEMEYYRSIQYVPRSMPIARDGIALIVNRGFLRDSISIDELKQLLVGSAADNANVVFDNSSSSTVRWIRDSILKTTPLGKNCFAVKTNPEVIRYVKEHKGAIGIIGNNWISNLNDSNVRNMLKEIKRVRIKNSGDDEFLEPYQNDLATGRYPLARMVYCIQRDGKVGLGTGLQRFLYDETGQLIVLKSGVMPFQQPVRSVHFNQE